MYPNIPFNYYFVNDSFSAQYQKDQQFAYQIDMNWTLLLLPLVSLMIIVGLSVGIQSKKVVLANPVNNLKDE